MIRVVLADGQVRVRSALRLMLEEESQIEVVGEAADATGLLLALDRKNPDMILLDWELPGLPPVKLLHLLRYTSPQLLVIAMSSRPEAKAAALGAGVNAFISKSESPERAREALGALLAQRPAAVDKASSDRQTTL